MLFQIRLNNYIHPSVSFAIKSRIYIILFGILAFYLGTPFDTSNHLDKLSKIHLNSILRAFSSWDAVYFKNIALNGYTLEQQHAFFPGLPFLMRYLSDYVSFFIEDKETSVLLSGILISNISFILAAYYLYKLSKLFFKDEKFSQLTSFAFSIQPAGIFMSSIYSESLFSLLSFMGLFMFYSGKKWTSAFIWACAGLVRSNGIVFVGFPLFTFIQSTFTKKFGIFTLPSTILQCGIILSGFLAFQIYGFEQFCANFSNERPWCKELVPSIYAFVQKEYWNIGFMKYYEVKQWPNFLLASPMIFLSLFGILIYASQDPLRFFTVGIFTKTPSISNKDSLTKTKTSTTKTSTTKPSPFVQNNAVLPFIYLWTILLFLVTSSMHVQIITRFFSFLPCVHWTIAHFAFTRQKKVLGWFMTYFAIYLSVGLVLFVNFYPPA